MPTLTQQLARRDAPSLFQMTVEQYHEMNRAGILPDGTPVELLDGVLVLKDRRDAEGDLMTVGTRHSGIVQHIHQMLQLVTARQDFHARCQQPVSLPPHHEPEPDIAIVQGTTKDYLTRKPRAEDALLVIEVADSSLRQDRSTKLPIYASAGIPTYWIVDLTHDRIELYSTPLRAESRYEQSETFDQNNKVAITFPTGERVELPVADLVPKADER